MPELAATAFVVGLLGAVHCFAMCGGIVSALNLRSTPVMRTGGGAGALSVRGTAAADLPIHLAYSAGRIASYATAGAVAGSVGSMALLAEEMLPAQIALGVAANVLLILLGFYLAGFSGWVARLEAAGGALWRQIAPLGKRFVPADTPQRAFAVGAVWGWLPCGLVYSTLAMALMSGSAANGAAIMLAFGLGTLPNLVAAGFAVQRMRAALARPEVRRAAGALVAILGMIGLVRVPGLLDRIRDGLLCLT